MKICICIKGNSIKSRFGEILFKVGEKYFFEEFKDGFHRVYSYNVYCKNDRYITFSKYVRKYPSSLGDSYEYINQQFQFDEFFVPLSEHRENLINQLIL